MHQKIDRVARRHIKKFLPGAVPFPGIQQILHFEGNNGPDAIKRKSPSKDEPWHFIDPTKSDDMILVEHIRGHLHNLCIALRDSNEERAAFEAAWLAHAIVDGLTPAHHFPLSDKIEELWGKPHHERFSVKDKNIIKGHNRRDTVSKNWQYWGVGGVFTAHLAFELGIASTIAPLKFKDIGLTQSRIDDVNTRGFEVVFMEMVHTINDMHLYEEFGEKGWTRRLADRSRRVLMPRIARTVALAWLYAANQVKEKL